jgi:ABC-type glycerol-3-phosphate transport system substrate-binding protein
MNKKLLAIVAIIVVIIIVLLLVFLQVQNGSRKPTNGTVTINFWGLWDEAQVYEPLFKEYESKNPNVKIVYTQKRFGNTDNYSYKGQYQTTVDERLKDGTVDIVRVHQSWIPRIIGNLAPAPQSLFNERSVKANYYPAISEIITTTKGEVYGAPSTIDGLVLIYNKDIFAREGITSPPTNWDEVIAISKKITKTQNGQITQAGINLGAGSNTLHPFEIVLLMMTQSDVNIASIPSGSQTVKATFATTEAAAAVNSYLDYSKKHAVWSTRLNNDLQTFAEGKLGMIIVPSWRAIEITNLNSKLSFDIAPVPVFPGANADTPQYVASYWIDVVPKKSPNSTEAWKLLSWLSEPEQLRKVYNEQKKVRLLGNVYPRVDMANELSDTPYAKVIVQMAPRMKSWPLYDYGIWEEEFKKFLISNEAAGKTVNTGDLERLQSSLNSLIFDKK